MAKEIIKEVIKDERKEEVIEEVLKIVNPRELTQKMIAKSQLKEKDLTTENGFVPTKVWFTFNSSYGYYNINFDFCTFESNGRVVNISAEPQRMPSDEMELLLTGLQVPSNLRNKFCTKGYFRLIRVKGSKVLGNGDLQYYDFMRYELFITLKDKKYADLGLFYHRPINRRTGKPISIKWATVANIKAQTELPYFVVTNVDVIDEEEGYEV